ncbi:MAG: DUF899 domain-containing protein [Acidimicrobiales bacterium]
MTSSEPTIVDREGWIAARLELMDREKAFTRQREELSETRRGLPWLEITQDYRFEGPDGEAELGELFDGRSQLLVYHFMLGPGWDEGCPSCSFWADNYNGTEIHLRARDTNLVAVSRAPLSEIEQYRTRMEWGFPWYSSNNSSFNYDMGVSFTEESIAAGEMAYNFGTQPAHGDESAGISIFAKHGDRIFLTYQTFARGLDMLNGTYHMLDLTPKGRDEDDLPWTMAWLRRHDSYTD